MKKVQKIIKRIIHVPPEEADYLEKEVKRSEQAWKKAVDNRDLRVSPLEKKILSDLKKVVKRIME